MTTPTNPNIRIPPNIAKNVTNSGTASSPDPITLDRTTLSTDEITTKQNPIQTKPPIHRPDKIMKIPTGHHTKPAPKGNIDAAPIINPHKAAPCTDNSAITTAPNNPWINPTSIVPFIVARTTPSNRRTNRS